MIRRLFGTKASKVADDKCLRVLHIPSSVGGNPDGLSKHLALLGVHSEVWECAPNFFGYPADKTIWNAKDGRMVREWKRWAAIWCAARDFDVIHFNFGTTLSLPFPFFRKNDRGCRRKIMVFLYACYSHVLFFLELALYRLYRRPTFIHYQGDDARQGDYSLEHFEYSIARYVENGYYCYHTDRFKRAMIARMTSYCVKIYTVNPDLKHVLPPDAQFVPYCHISLQEWMPDTVDSTSEGDRPLRIGHAPSHRGAKGTDIILDALRRLRAEGHNFELDLIEGVSNASARERYKSLDVLIDQLFAGWYGGLAVEAMALGKPVVVYIRDGDLKFVPDAMRVDLPIIRITPATVIDVLRSVVSMSRGQLQVIGRDSRRYVERWHNPNRIAHDILKDYEKALSEVGSRGSRKSMS